MDPEGVLAGIKAGDVEGGIDLTVLSEALHLAQTAVAADREMHYYVAASAYKRAVECINASILSAASHQQEQLAALCAQYTERWTQLEEVRPELSLMRLKKDISDSKEPPRRTSDKLRKMSLSVLPFVEMEALLMTSCEAPPNPIPRRPYWQLRILKQALNRGGWLAPGVYLPEEVWRQRGSKIHGYEMKVSALQRVYEVFRTIQNITLPSDGSSFETKYKREATHSTMQGFLDSFSDAVDDLLGIYDSLSDSFPYLLSTDKSLTSQKKKKKRSVSERSNIRKAMSGIWRTARQVRDANVLTRRISSEELEKLALIAASVCEQAQFLDGWLTYFKVPSCTGKDGSPPPGAHSLDRQASRSELPLNADSIVRGIHVRMGQVGSFLRNCVAEMILHDSRFLLSKYLRKQRRALVRHVDFVEDESDDEEEP